MQICSFTHFVLITPDVVLNLKYYNGQLGIQAKVPGWTQAKIPGWAIQVGPKLKSLALGTQAKVSG